MEETSARVSADKEFALFKEAEQERTQRIYQQAKVLKLVAESLTRISGENCHVARHGGEEFVLIMPQTSPVPALATGTRIQQTLADAELELDTDTAAPGASVDAVATFKNKGASGTFDIKIDNLTGDILRKALSQAREGRLFIIGKLRETIAQILALDGIQVFPDQVLITSGSLTQFLTSAKRNCLMTYRRLH